MASHFPESARTELRLRLHVQNISAATILFFVLASAACGRRPSTPPQGYAFVSNGGSNSVSVIDLSSLQLVRTIGVGNNPTGVTPSPTRAELYVVNTGSDNVSVIDGATLTVVSTIGVHAAPYFIDVSRDGKRGYVANSGSSNVS